MDIWVNQGRGYRPAESQETYSLGEIPIDAIYTPVQKVNYVVEHTRVGQMTDFDSLILEILTDGTIEPDDALSEAAQILVEHGQVFADFNSEPEEESAETGPGLPDEVLNKPLADLGLSPRVLNALRGRGIDKVGQVLAMPEEELMTIRNFGPRSFNELKAAMIEQGYMSEGQDGEQSSPKDGEAVLDDDSGSFAEALKSIGIENFDLGIDEE